MSIPIHQFIPPPSLLGNHKFLTKNLTWQKVKTQNFISFKKYLFRSCHALSTKTAGFWKQVKDSLSLQEV